jgi:O-antigen/teichoic acid export membrane protein
MVFINLSIVLIDSGLNTALVQDRHTTNDDYSTVFYISLAIASLLIIVLWLTAPLIGSYYDDSAIVLPLRVYSFSLLIGAANAVLVAKMQREMRFKQMMWCNLIACVISGCVGVAMAYAGFGIWALIAYYFTSSLLICLSLSYVTKWYPALVFSIQRAKVLFSFGWKMLVSGLLCGLYNDLRALIIGKVYSPADLGYYNRGQQFPDIVSHTLDNAIQSVMFPVMSQVQDDCLRVKLVLRRTMSMGALVIVPLMFGMAVVSAPFIELLLTAKWLPCVPYMQCICIGFAALPMASSSLVAIKAIGRSDVYMRLEIVRRIAMLIVLLISVFCFDSVLAIAVGFAISSWIDYIVISIPIKKMLNFSFVEQIKCFSRTLVCSLLMSVFVYLIGYIDLPPIVMLIVQAIIGVVTYIVLSYLLNKNALNEAIGALTSLRSPKQR